MYTFGLFSATRPPFQIRQEIVLKVDVDCSDDQTQQEVLRQTVAQIDTISANGPCATKCSEEVSAICLPSLRSRRKRSDDVMTIYISIHIDIPTRVNRRQTEDYVNSGSNDMDAFAITLSSNLQESSGSSAVVETGGIVQECTDGYSRASNSLHCGKYAHINSSQNVRKLF